MVVILPLSAISRVGEVFILVTSSISFFSVFKYLNYFHSLLNCIPGFLPHDLQTGFPFPQTFDQKPRHCHPISYKSRTHFQSRRPLPRMAPPNAPSRVELFFANNQTPILLGAFATQVCHHQYLNRTEPAIASAATSIRSAYLPRRLRAGLGWGVVFLGLLTQITLSKQAVNAVRDHNDPILAHLQQKRPWKPMTEGTA